MINDFLREFSDFLLLLFSPVTLNVTVKSKQIFIGGSATFTCEVNPQEINVTYKWFRNSHLLGQTSQNITIEKAPMDLDGSEIKCRASVNSISGEGAGTLKIKGIFFVQNFIFLLLLISTTD